jgi:hypothetical protein
MMNAYLFYNNNLIKYQMGKYSVSIEFALIARNMLGVQGIMRPLTLLLLKNWQRSTEAGEKILKLV